MHNTIHLKASMVSKSTFLTCFSTTLFFLLQLHVSAGTTNIVKAAYWYSGIPYPASAIDSTLFTHLLCAFADLDSQTNEATISTQNQPLFANFTQTVQIRNPSVKTLLSIGGGGGNKTAFASMASQASTRKSFIDSSINLARSNNFHGLDIDWEFPSSATDMANLGALVTEWRAAAVNEAGVSGKTPLLLTAAVYYSSKYRSLDHPIEPISNSLDWVNVMAYSFYGPNWSPNMTGPPAALYNPISPVSGDSGLTAWIQAGLGANKIVFGIPYYGYAWNLIDPNEHHIFAPANGSAITPDGSLGYILIKACIALKKAQKVFNATVVSDYTYSGKTWIGYDDVQSVCTKVLYAKAKGLLGYFAWNVAFDNNWVLSKAASNAWDA